MDAKESEAIGNDSKAEEGLSPDEKEQLEQEQDMGIDMDTITGGAEDLTLEAEAHEEAQGQLLVDVDEGDAKAEMGESTGAASKESDDSMRSSPVRDEKSYYERENEPITHNPAELQALEAIDNQCTALQQEGRYAEALECMEKGLVLRQHYFGSSSPEVWEACRTVGEMCNLLAMTYLQQEEFPTVLELLKKAEILSERDPAGRAVTLNNLACYHRRQGNLHAALKSLTRASDIEAKLPHVPNRADTHLNMCAVLSQLGRHQAALEQAQSALILLHEELFSPSQEGNNVNEKVDRIAVLGIAYHNVGAEYEFLKKHSLANQSYQKGAEITEQYLGKDHGIVITLKNSLVTAKRTAPKTKTGSKSKHITRSNSRPRIERSG